MVTGGRWPCDDDDDDDDERMYFNVAQVLGLQGHVTVIVGSRSIVSAVRRSLVRAAVRPGKKFSLQSTAENWQ